MDTKKDSAATERMRRGIKLHRERGHEIERINANVYRVPSCGGSGSYHVDLGLGCCDCPDHPAAKKLGTRCKHYHAAVIHQSKRRACSRRRRTATPKRTRHEAKPSAS